MPDGAPITAAVRSEAIDLLPAGEEGIPSVVKEKRFSAGMLRIALVTAAGEEITASRHGIDYAVAPGDAVSVSFAPEKAVLVEAEDERP